MRIEPAHIDQIRCARSGNMVAIHADVGGVAQDLKQIDAGLAVRFVEAGKHWAVLHEYHSGCPHNGEGGEGSTYLVTTSNAHQTNTGVWTGLDQRVVDRMREIHPLGSYNYARELEKSRDEVARRRQEKFRETVGETAEVAAHAIRKDLGLRYKGRAFKPV